MPASSSTSGVSRRVLARSPAVQRTTGAAFIVGGAISMVGVAALDRPALYGVPCLIAGVVAGVLTLTRPPTPADGRWNHLLIAGAYLVPSLAYYALLPDAAAATPGFVFSGAIIPFRLVSRRLMAAHLAVISALLLLPVALGLADGRTLFAVCVLLVGITSLTAIVTVVLEAAEAQGNELEQLVRRDPLTGVGNRRLLAERLDYELRRHRRSEHRLTLLAFDLNGFKEINDHHGHAAGDELLVAVATTLRSGVRAQDTVVRQGGDEFCVLLPETTHAGALQIGATLREALAGITAGELPLTTGLGIAEFPTDGDEIDALLRVADERLRADKLHGDRLP
ncbi:MAG: GGDEF domain-containing protein [Solirubrobacteraceae bacterium]|nr:GGDEF domain-containing protein [Solirubrobacteraceae bacterium]